MDTAYFKILNRLGVTEGRTDTVIANAALRYVARPKTLTNINQIISNTILSCQRVIKHSTSRCFLEVGLYQYSFSILSIQLVRTGSLSGGHRSQLADMAQKINSLSLSAAYTVLQPTSGTRSQNSRGDVILCTAHLKYTK